MAYSILIADDEEPIRKGLAKLLGGMGQDFHIIEACDGQEAADVLHRDRPDIALMDVSMPCMNGLDVIHGAIAAGISTKVIVVSGYSEFEYAQKALNYGACGYLLKPVSRQQLEEMVRKILSPAAEGISFSGRRSQQAEGRQSAIVQWENEVCRWISVPQSVQAKEGEAASSLQQRMSSPHTLALLHIDKCNSIQPPEGIHDVEGMRSDIRARAEARGGAGKLLVLDNLMNRNELFLIAAGDPQKSGTMMLTALLSAIREETGYSLTAAVKTANSPIDHAAYQAMRDSLELRFSSGINRDYMVNAGGPAAGGAVPPEMLRNIALSLNKSDYEGFRRFLADLFFSTRKVNGRSAYLAVIFELVKECGKRGIGLETVLAQGDIVGEVLDYMDSIDDIIGYLYTTVVETLKKDVMETANCRDIVVAARSIIDRDPRCAYSVKEMAYRFSINPNYLSTLFKQVVGQGFVEYVNNKKIVAACEMLMASQVSVTEISDHLGFEDVQYFFKLFRKVKGVTPLEYRKQAR